MDLPDNNLRTFVQYSDCSMRMFHVFRHVTLFFKRAYTRNITLQANCVGEDPALVHLAQCGNSEMSS